MKHHLFSTSYNLIMHSPKNIPITPKKFDVNRTNYPNKSSFKLLGSQKQQLSELNNYFPYHIFNKFCHSFNNDYECKIANISNQINIIDKAIVDDENYLQKIWNDDINEYIHKLKYGPEFFITFAKKKKETLTNKSCKSNKKKDCNTVNRRFRKNFALKKKARVNFYDIIINETQKTNTSNKEEKEIKDKNSEVKVKKFLTTNYFRNNNSHKKYLLKENINNNKTQENNSHYKPRIKDNINTISNTSNFRNYNSTHRLKLKKRIYDLSKLKFPYFPEIIDNNKYFRYNKKSKLNSITKNE